MQPSVKQEKEDAGVSVITPCEESSVIAESGIVRLNFTTPASVAIHAPNSKQRLSHEMMHLLRRDHKDFQELEWNFNEEAGESGAGKDNVSSFNDAASQRSAYSYNNSVSCLQSGSTM